MRRVLPATLLVAVVLLAATAPVAAAAPPPVHKTAIGTEAPIQAYGSVVPPVQLFGDPITAQVVVVADTKAIRNPARISVTSDFSPYKPTGRPTVTRTVSGRFLEETWTWSLNCLSTPCVPVVPPSDLFHNFRFRAVQVEYRGPHGKVLYRIAVHFPRVEELSEVSPGILVYLKNNKTINWQYQLPAAAASPFRVSPALVFWPAVALAALLGAAGLLVLVRWVLGLRAVEADAEPALPPSYLERALALFFWANAQGDETLQRKALERVADELPLDVIDLSAAARELAWSPERPEEDEVEAISERAGVPAHHDENGAGG